VQDLNPGEVEQISGGVVQNPYDPIPVTFPFGTKLPWAPLLLLNVVNA
jgi:hypothetical protein